MVRQTFLTTWALYRQYRPALDACVCADGIPCMSAGHDVEGTKDKCIIWNPTQVIYQPLSWMKET
jgi:hypothetical protein